MIGLPATIRVFVAAGSTDLRRGFDGLAPLARDRLEREHLSGHPLDFVFADRCRDRVKILCRDGDPFWMADRKR